LQNDFDEIENIQLLADSDKSSAAFCIRASSTGHLHADDTWRAGVSGSLSAEPFFVAHRR